MNPINPNHPMNPMNPINPINKNTKTAIFLFFLGSAAGCVFAVVPLVKRKLTGQIAGTVGAYGNVGAVVFLLVFSFVSPSVFFATIAAGVAIAAFCTLFLDEPKSKMAEVMPDGTVQFIDVH